VRHFDAVRAFYLLLRNLAACRFVLAACQSDPRSPTAELASERLAPLRHFVIHPAILSQRDDFNVVILVRNAVGIAVAWDSLNANGNERKLT